MGDIDLTGSRVVLYQVTADGLWQTDKLFTFKSITPFISDHLFFGKYKKKKLYQDTRYSL
jgi:hypothetical protein